MEESLDDLQAQLAAEKASVGQKVREDIATAESEANNKNRGLIVVCVISVYTGVITAITLYLIYKGIATGSAEFANLSELVKIAVVPIVTLVIGYYFGHKND